MAGEIRKAMADLRAAKVTMVSDMLAQISEVTSEISATHADGLDALKLPRAELQATKQEIAEIRAEFAEAGNESSNLSPLPVAPKPSPAPSVTPAPSVAPAQVPNAPVATAEKKTTE